jgi:hypothetical protein
VIARGDGDAGEYGTSTTRSTGPIRAFPDAWYRTSANGCRRAGERHFEDASIGG